MIDGKRRFRRQAQDTEFIESAGSTLSKLGILLGSRRVDFAYVSPKLFPTQGFSLKTKKYLPGHAGIPDRNIQILWKLVNRNFQKECAKEEGCL